jgi:hypothetical protein
MARGATRARGRIAMALVVFPGLCSIAAAGADQRAAQEGRLDLTGAVVVIPEGVTGPEEKAAAMLVEEVGRRTQVRWDIARGWPDRPGPVIAVGQEAGLRAIEPRIGGWLGPNAVPQAAEGFRIQVVADEKVVLVVGKDPRGVLFGVGRLLRELRMAKRQVWVPERFGIATAPRYRLRGHQLGYRPKTNSYDGWDIPEWEQYIRDLAVFGTNAIELIPPRSDDAPDSPHFPRPPLEMMIAMSRQLDQYGLDVWIWYPALDRDYADPETVAFALKEWSEIFRKLPRIDAVFVPGGDPGHTRPNILMSFLEKQADALRRYHPKAQLWVSPQGFNREWLDEFLQLLRAQPAWLSGIVFGPQVRITLSELREAVPSRYPIRLYPDITHSLQCQYPVPDWDLAFALTEGREIINPRPLGQAIIFRATAGQSIGFLSYSEGCNDDVNKMIWSGLGWDPEADVTELMRQYGRYFIGARYAEAFAQGLLALERNWRGPLLTNADVETTLHQFQDLERSASPQELRNWRFQQALYRAYYDAYVRDRLIRETALESEAMGVLRRAGELGSRTALDRAEAVLDRAVIEPVSPDRRARVFELAEALFQSIHMQLSVSRYKAIDVDRGATLDTIDVPLNNRVWLKTQFAELRQKGSEAERLRGIAAVVQWTDPGPGGFYDSLGDLTRQPHLVRGLGFERDPDFRRSALVGFGERPDWPMAWRRNAQSLYDAPVRLHYEGLDRTARYCVRVVYAGDSFRTRIRLEAEGIEVHPLLTKPDPVRPVEFAIPTAATADGALTLSWTRDPGLGGNGRGCEISEVWLIRQGEPAE